MKLDREGLGGVMLSLLAYAEREDDPALRRAIVAAGREALTRHRLTAIDRSQPVVSLPAARDGLASDLIGLFADGPMKRGAPDAQRRRTGSSEIIPLFPPAS